MILLLDIGNTHTHLGLADGKKIARTRDLPTKNWFAGTGAADLLNFLDADKCEGAALCSVVPDATPLAILAIQQLCHVDPLELTHAMRWPSANSSVRPRS
jgi:pantothenate kinase type III